MSAASSGGELSAANAATNGVIKSRLCRLAAEVGTPERVGAAPAGARGVGSSDSESAAGGAAHGRKVAPQLSGDARSGAGRTRRPRPQPHRDFPRRGPRRAGVDELILVSLDAAPMAE